MAKKWVKAVESGISLILFKIGAINETWFKAEKVGTYYGQCSELCGIKHAFMPIEVRVVTEEEYQEWLLDAKVKFAKEINEEDQFKKLVSK